MNSLEKEFVPYKESSELKEIGFGEPCFGFYERKKELVIQESEITDFHYDSLQCVAPTLSQAFRWFRERYKLHCHIEYIPAADVYEWWIKYDRANYPTYEEAELACLRKLIEIAKNTTKP